MKHCQAIVLSVLDFRENDRIATIFSPLGLLKLFVKGKSSRLVTVLSEGEFLFEKGKSDLYRFRDVTIINQHLGLRERFENMQAAGQLAKAIIKSQLPEKEAPELYQLFSYFLQMIPKVNKPEDLVMIFLVKILKYEGLFGHHDHCSVCKKKADHRFGGERFCKTHAPQAAIMLDEEKLMEIAEGRSFHKLIAKPYHLHSQVALLFEQAFL